MFLVSVLRSLSIPLPFLLLSLEGLPFVPSCSLPYCGSSWVFYPIGGPSPPPPISLVLLFIGNFFTCWVPDLSFWFFPGSLLRLLGFPSVRPPHAPLLGLARLCPCVLLVPLLCDSLESQFLRDGVLPTGRVSAVGGSCFLSHGFASCLLLLVSFLICSDFSPSF